MGYEPIALWAYSQWASSGQPKLYVACVSLFVYFPIMCRETVILAPTADHFTDPTADQWCQSRDKFAKFHSYSQKSESLLVSSCVYILYMYKLMA